MVSPPFARFRKTFLRASTSALRSLRWAAIPSLPPRIPSVDAMPGVSTLSPRPGRSRTREGVLYDYERKNRYLVTVGVEDRRGNSDAIDVTIHIVDLAPSCGPPSRLNLRTNHSDERLTLRWDPLPDMPGHARVLGYETEIRRGRSGPWTDRRTFMGRNLTGMVYADLVNEAGYQVRVRPINAEGICGWSTPVGGTPTAGLAPQSPAEYCDRFGTQPIGTSDRNFQCLTPRRCRYTSNGRSLDADCEYANTGPNTARITLEFDDPSEGVLRSRTGPFIADRRIVQRRVLRRGGQYECAVRHRFPHAAFGTVGDSPPHPAERAEDAG